MMWNDDGRYGMHESGLGWLMALLMLVLVVAVIIAVVALLRGTTSVSTGTPPAVGGGTVVDARRILQERFARGDIDEQDFRTRMRALDDTGAGTT